MSKILIVDDEMMVLRVMQRTLSNHFEVVTVISTETVAEVLATQGPFDAAISDFLMPGYLTGADVLTTARMSYPNIGCILHSGGAPGVKMEDVVRDHCPPGTVLLEKPAALEEILAALRRVLPQG